MNSNLTYEIVSMAFQSLWNRKLRAFLTIIGIIIGITSVVGMTGLLRGLDTSMKSQLLSLSADVFFVTKLGGRLMGHEEYRKLLKRPPLTTDDAKAIRRHIPDVAEVSLVVDRGRYGPVMHTLNYRGVETSDMMIMGADSNYFRVYQQNIVEGRTFTDAENRARRKVVVLASGPAEALFGDRGEDDSTQESSRARRAEGKTIRFDGETWTVVGVLEKRKGLMGDGGGQNNFVIIPERTYIQHYPSEEQSFQLGIQPASSASPARVMEEVIQFLRQRRGLKVHEDNNFDVITQESLLELWKNLTQTIVLALTVLSSVALLVGGIGVMAVMLVTVTERTSEVGTRMAIGAKRRDILLQFLVEAAVLTTVGGVLGIASGSSLGYVLSWSTGLPISFPLWSYGVSLASSAAIGIVFGVYPAQRAARLNPVEALRYRR